VLGCDPRPEGKVHEATGIHHTCRRRRSCIFATHNARAKHNAKGADRLPDSAPAGSGGGCVDRRFKQSRVDGGAEHYNRAKNLFGDMDCLEKSAVELAKLKLDVIVAVATSGVQAVRSATTSIPIVMAATGDPIGQGFVASLARLGGRITGTSFDAGPEITTKQLQLILDVVPKASRIAVLWNPAAPFIRTYWTYAQDAAPALHVTLQSEEVLDSKDFERAFDAMVREEANALMVLSDSLMSSNRVTLAQLAADRKIPALYGHNLYTEARPDELWTLRIRFDQGRGLLRR
jgi:hypothetical protein